MKTRLIILTLFGMLAASVLMGIFNVDPTSGSAFVITATLGIVGGMKSSKELKEEKGKIWERAQAIVDKAKTETRDMNEGEVTDYDNLLEQMRSLDKQIERSEEHERRMLEMAGAHINDQNKKNEQRELKSYSIIRAMSSMLPGSNQELNGLELEMHQEAVREAQRSGISLEGVGVPSIISRSEKRGFSVTGDAAAKGGELVQTEVMTMAQALTDKLVLQELGVNIMTGLVGNMKLPRDGEVSATWEGETDENAETDNNITAISLNPHRLGAKSLVSKQLIHQAGNMSIEAFIWNKLINAVQRKLQETFINGSGAGDIPLGLLGTPGIGSVAGGTNGAAPTREHLLALEKEIAIDNALRDMMKFLTNSKVRYKLRGTALDAGSGQFVWPKENDLIGYPAVVTNAVPSNLTKGTAIEVCSAIVLGVWEKAIVGQWAGLDLVLDPYTKADFGQHRLIVNSWWDIAFERPEYFAAMLDALT